MAVANPHMMDENYSFTTCDMLITDLETGMELYSGTLKSHSISKTSTKTPIRAGISGITWVELEDSSEITIEVVELREKLDMEALKLSGFMTLDTEDIELTAFPKNYELEVEGNDLKVTLPVDHKEVNTRNEAIAVYFPETGAVINPDYVELEAGVIKIKKEQAGTDGTDQLIPTLQEKDLVMVGSYKYLQSDASTIHIAAEQVGTNVSVTLKQPIYGADKKIKMWRQYHFYRCSLASDFTQESATEMAEQNTTTSFTVLKDPKRDTLGFVSYVPVAPSYGLDNAPFRRKNRSKAKAQAKA